MTNKLVVTTNSLKYQKIKKILLYEMNFFLPNYSCLQNPWLRGYRPQIPVLSVLCPQLNLLNPLRTKFLGTPLGVAITFCLFSSCCRFSRENQMDVSCYTARTSSDVFMCLLRSSYRGPFPQAAFSGAATSCFHVQRFPFAAVLLPTISQ